MKVVKFGRIFVDENGALTVTEFEFQTDRPDENPNRAENVVPAILNHLCNVWQVAEIIPCSDRKSEIIVADAIEKARSAK
ncbi:TPA: hypothetical protein ACG1QI_004286 [Enterobacter kobei]|nr:hypothetical protein [Enterobacter cloacae]